MQASLLSFLDTRLDGFTVKESLPFRTASYHKLLEFFFFGFVLSMLVISSGGWPNQLRWRLVCSAIYRLACSGEGPRGTLRLVVYIGMLLHLKGDHELKI